MVEQPFKDSPPYLEHFFFKQVDPSFWALFVGVMADNLSSAPPSKPNTTLMAASGEGSGSKMDFLSWRVYFLSE